MTACRCVSDHRPPVLQDVVHHILPKGMGGPDTPDNLITLCDNTHRNVHEILREFVRAGKILPRVTGQPWYSYNVAVDGFKRWSLSNGD